MENVTTYLKDHGFGHIKVDSVDDKIYGVIKNYVDGNYPEMIENLSKLNDLELKTLLDNDTILNPLKMISDDEQHLETTCILAKYYGIRGDVHLEKLYRKNIENYKDIDYNIGYARYQLKRALEWDSVETYEASMEILRTIQSQYKSKGKSTRKIEIKILLADAVWNGFDACGEISRYMDVESLVTIATELFWYVKQISYDQYSKLAWDCFDKAKKSCVDSQPNFALMQLEKMAGSIEIDMCHQLFKEAEQLHQQAEQKYNIAMKKFSETKTKFEIFAPNRLFDLDVKNCIIFN